MLRLIYYQHRKQVADFLKQQIRSEVWQDQTWVVSDLKTKNEFQNIFLSEKGYFLNQNVIRASEYWKSLLATVSPELQIISDVVFKVIIKKYIPDPIEETKFYQNLKTMGHLLLTDIPWQELDETIEDSPEWPELKKLISQLLPFRDIFIEKYQMILADWLPSYLLQKMTNESKRISENSISQVTYDERVSPSISSKNLYVDLGSEFRIAEAELLKILAAHNEIYIFTPQLNLTDQNTFNDIYKPYNDLMSVSVEKIFLSPSLSKETESAEIEFKKFPGPLAEVKFAVGFCRQLLQDETIKPEHICILSPEIKSYETLLKAYLSVEGIPCQQNVSVRFLDIPVIQQWLSQLFLLDVTASDPDSPSSENKNKNLKKLFEVHHLENTLFSSFHRSHNPMVLNFSDFERQTKNAMFKEDLLIWSNYLNSNLKTNIDNPDDLQEMNGKEFIQYSKNFWQSEDTHYFAKVVEIFYKNAPLHISLDFLSWLSILENILAKSDESLSLSQEDGVQINSLQSIPSGPHFYIVLGLNTNFMKKEYWPFEISPKLMADLGLDWQNPLQNPMDFELLLLIQNPTDKIYLSYPATDSRGELCSPAKIWLRLQKNNLNLEYTNLEPSTRWDEIQKNTILPTAASTNYKNQNSIRFSPSSLEQYIRCPFVFAVKNFFKLTDDPDIDLDLDRRLEGQLVHSLLEKITESEAHLSWSRSEIYDYLETLKQKLSLFFWEDLFWQNLKVKTTEMSLKFIELEKEQKILHPEIKTAAREYRFKVEWKWKNQSVILSGIIDRIDQSKDQKLIIYDYKLSGGSLKSHSSWIKDFQLQLLFYAWMIQNNYLPDVQGEVVGLSYYIMKDLTKKGLFLTDYAEELSGNNIKKSQQVPKETLTKYLIEFQNILESKLEKIHSGFISPEPLDINQCVTCRWKDLCRAPHLI